MENLLIQGGMVVDGTGAPARRADIRLRNGRIAAIGPDLKPENGERAFDASGCFVAPGFIESHTHYDGTMWWQPDLDPLPGYGVTTAIMGNCGFSAAPISDDAGVRAEIAKIFSFFEDIPEKPFLNELPWDWRTWSEYKQSMTSRLRIAANYGAFVGHLAIRLAVMGHAAWERAATADEIARMVALLEDALDAGAMGLSTNLLDHDGAGRPVPTFKADDAEWTALIATLARYKGVSMEVALDTVIHLTAAQSIRKLAKLCEGHDVRVQWAGGVPTLKFQAAILPELKALHEDFKRDGKDYWAGYAHVPITSVINIRASLIFAQSDDFAWHEIVQADSDDDKLALLRDSAWRARARESWDHKAVKHSPFGSPQNLLLLDSANGAGPVNLSVVDLARRRGVHPSDAMADWFIENGLDSTVHMAPFEMIDDAVADLLRDPKSVGNISDAPAHGQMFCGGGYNMILFDEWVKGKREISVEAAVHIQTGKLADYFNLTDRGVLAVGKRADITVFNLDEIQMRDMEKVRDVPNGDGGMTWRWTRKPAPVRLTLVNGEPTFENGAFTGAFPGEMVSPTLLNPARSGSGA
jgi:N-acyl-D-aspartate/D-glutamate deacylase